MYKFSLSWSIKIEGTRDRGALKMAAWHEVEPVLARLQPHSGSVSVFVVEGPDVGPQKMLLFADSGKYVVVLSELIGDDYRMRSLHNPDAIKGTETAILGQAWNAAQVSTRYDDVTEAFRQLITSGNVSRELLN